MRRFRFKTVVTFIMDEYVGLPQSHLVTPNPTILSCSASSVFTARVPRHHHLRITHRDELAKLTTLL